VALFQCDSGMNLRQSNILNRCVTKMASLGQNCHDKTGYCAVLPSALT